MSTLQTTHHLKNGVSGADEAGSLLEANSVYIESIARLKKEFPNESGSDQRRYGVGPARNSNSGLILNARSVSSSPENSTQHRPDGLQDDRTHPHGVASIIGNEHHGRCFAAVSSRNTRRIPRALNPHNPLENFGCWDLDFHTG